MSWVGGENPYGDASDMVDVKFHDGAESTGFAASFNWNFNPARANIVAHRPHPAPSAIGGEAEPVAWRHTLHMELEQKSVRVTLTSDDPFGEQGKDYDPTYVCFSEPLYLARQGGGK